MADPTYKPQFRQVDLIDNVDPITATGPNGLNARFDAIAGDLRQLSTVVDEIDAALDVLADPNSGGATIQRQPTILVPLDLLSIPNPGNPPVGGWTFDSAGVAHPDNGLGGGQATMGITLPNGIRLTAIRVTGGFEGGNARLIFQLGRTRIAAPTQPQEILARIASDQRSFSNPYDIGVQTDKNLSIVDLTQFRYFLLVSADTISQPTVTSLAAVQLNFLGAPTD